MLSKYAGLYLNSSFRYPALLAIDLPSGGPNYPLATPFVRLAIVPIEGLTLIGAVYTSDPAPPGEGNPQLRDRHGTAFRLDDHWLSFAELRLQAQIGRAFGLTCHVQAWNVGRYRAVPRSIDRYERLVAGEPAEQRTAAAALRQSWRLHRHRPDPLASIPCG